MCGMLTSAVMTIEKDASCEEARRQEDFYTCAHYVKNKKNRYNVRHKASQMRVMTGNNNSNQKMIF